MNVTRLRYTVFKERVFVTKIYRDYEDEPKLVKPTYLKTFLSEILSDYEKHVFECSTSKLRYLRDDYRKILDRCGPYWHYVRQQIGGLNKLIKSQFVPVENPIEFLLKEYDGVYSIILDSGEVLFSSSEETYARLLLSPLLYI